MLVVTFTNAAASEMRERILEVIRNYFYEIDISANFQIGDSSEMELLKQETLDEVMEEKYIQKDEEFLMLVDTYANYRGDENLKELILKIDNQIQSSPFPKEWLKEKVKMFDLRGKLEQDFSKTIWGRLILQEIAEETRENRLKLEKIIQKLRKYPELEKYILTILNDKEQLEKIEAILQGEENTWERTYQAIQELQFERWPTDK